MKRVLFWTLLLFSASAFAQSVGPGYVYYVTSAPSGNCSQGANQQILITTGAIYTCQSGTWAQVGAGTGTVTAVTATSPVASSGGTAPVISLDSTGLTSLIAYATDTSVSANTITLAVPAWYPASATLGSCVNFKAANSTSGATVINITPAGGSVYVSNTLDKRTATGVAALSASGDIIAGSWYEACFDSVEWVVATTSSTVYTGGALGAGKALTGNNANQIAALAGVIFTSNVFSTYNSILTAGVGMASVQASPAVIVIGSGASIANTSLCSTTLCPAGMYTVHAFLDITTACGTTGTYAVNLLWTDDQGAKTAVINFNGTGAVPATGLVTTTSTGNFGENAQVIHTTGAANNALGSINYSTTAVACGTAGPMVGNLYLSVTRVQ